jgi:uncharacterized protein DUF5980
MREPRFLRLAGIVSLAALLLGASPRVLAPTGSETDHAEGAGTWTLVDYQQTACFDGQVTTAYYGIWIRGSWTKPIRIGLASLPAGSETWTTYAPIPPGSSSGEYSLAYVGVEIPANTPVGTYTAQLWAREGRLRQSVPVTLSVETDCGY